MGQKSREKRERRQNKPFHISVGAACVIGDGGVEEQTLHQIRLLKAALLYADKVTLYSPMVTTMLANHRMATFTVNQQIELIRQLGPTLYDDSTLAQVEDFLNKIKLIGRLKSKSKEMGQLNSEFMSLIRGQFEGLRNVATQTNQQWHLNELNRLIKTGHVEIAQLGPKLSDVEIVAGAIQKLAHLEQLSKDGVAKGEPLKGNLDSHTDDVLASYVNMLEHTINSSKTYPLFDDETSNLVNLGIKEGLIKSSDVSGQRAKHLGLAANLLERLPMFEDASADELIDIRTELNGPLVRFRTAVSKFSSTFEAAPWEHGFENEAERIFRDEVEPVVVELEEKIASNNYILELGRRAVQVPFGVTAGSALGIGLTNTKVFGETIHSLVNVGASLGVLAIDAWKTWDASKREIEKNQLYFYYKAGSRLRSRH